MGSIFISHSSKDKDFVRRLADDLKALGHRPWLDEWEIKLGDCIVTKVEAGINDCDFVAIVLSKNSVSSPWVDREWKAKYWQEIQSNRKAILPLLLEDCEIPPLIASRRYADFQEKLSSRLRPLATALTPTAVVGASMADISATVKDQAISSLITKIAVAGQVSYLNALQTP